MSERLVAIPLEGVMHLYAVNGEGPVEVGRLNVGDALDVHALAIVGAALSDLRGMVAQLGVSALPSSPMPRGSYHIAKQQGGLPRTTYSLPRAPAPTKRAPRHLRGKAPDPDSLNGRIRAYLAEHGPSTSHDITANVGARATDTKSARQRVSTSLATLKRAGSVKREGSGTHGLWSLV